MKIGFVLAAAIVLAGCRMVFGDQSAETTFTPQGRTDSPFDAHCREVAQQRADDARENNYDEAMQDAVFQGTYADCVVFQESQQPR